MALCKGVTQKFYGDNFEQDIFCNKFFILQGIWARPDLKGSLMSSYSYKEAVTMSATVCREATEAAVAGDMLCFQKGQSHKLS
ncbi:hypothetical protein SUGI_0015640 [Cryptomeria japonica]|nr:hypothetical protein SUGI_0015640 [Cryptomeria japonica]